MQVVHLHYTLNVRPVKELVAFYASFNPKTLHVSVAAAELDEAPLLSSPSLVFE